MTTRRVPDHVIAEASRKLVERAREGFGTQRTGLVCPACGKPVGQIGEMSAQAVLSFNREFKKPPTPPGEEALEFLCPACGHEWTAPVR